MSNQVIRTIFMGTPEFALPGLKSLIEAADFEIIGVFTQTDKPVGRQQILTPPSVKELALQYDLKVFQPEKIKTEIETIKNLKPDLIVVIAYGKIIPQEILDIPKYNCINIHASLLPKYRGAACLNAPILNGDSETGVTIMKMEAGLDTGPILRQTKMILTGRETLTMVHDKLAFLGTEILVATLRDWVQGKIEPQIQDDSQSSYIKTLKKEDGRIDWSKPAIEIERIIRALNPWPGTHSNWKNKTIKIITVEQKPLEKTNKIIGQVFKTDNKLAIQCGQGALVILKLQLEGKKIMTSEEFLRGNQNFINQILN